MGTPFKHQEFPFLQGFDADLANAIRNVLVEERMDDNERDEALKSLLGEKYKDYLYWEEKMKKRGDAIDRLPRSLREKAGTLLDKKLYSSLMAFLKGQSQETRSLFEDLIEQEQRRCKNPTPLHGDHNQVYGRSKADIPFLATPDRSPAVPPRRAGCSYVEEKDTVDMANERSTRSYVTTTPVTHSRFSSLDFEKRYSHEPQSPNGWRAVSEPPPVSIRESSHVSEKILVPVEAISQRYSSFRRLKNETSLRYSKTMRSSSVERPPTKNEWYNSRVLADSDPEEGNPLNILLLGETGSGKSTFVNSFVNYSVYKNFEDALKYGVKVVIPTKFSCFSNACQVNVDDATNDNEDMETGMSSTQKCRSYYIKFGMNSDIRPIQIIDTPGIGDSRGFDQDEKNMDEILSYIERFKELHAICIVLTPNISKLSPIVRHCLEKLLLHLHKSAAQNIMFCFTHATQTHFQVGESFPLLEKYFAELNSKENRVFLSKSTCFMFDNECYRYLCAKRCSVNLGDEVKSGSRDSWNRSRNELRRFLRTIEKLKGHDVATTTSLYSTKKIVYALCAPIVDVITIIMENSVKIEEAVREIENMRKDAKSLQYIQNNYRQMHISIDEIDTPRTVCTSKLCTAVHSSENGPDFPVYRSCHSTCYLKDITPERTKNPALRSCRIINKSGNCNACGCSWELHMHQKFRISVEDRSILSEEMLRTLDGLNTAKDRQQSILNSLKEELNSLYNDYDYILDSCAIFSTFLAKSSIAGKIDYVYYNLRNMLDQEEADKTVTARGENLRRILGDYERCRDKLKCKKINEAMVNSTIDSLKKLRSVGRQIEEILTIQSQKCLNEGSADLKVLVNPDLLQEP